MSRTEKRFALFWNQAKSVDEVATRFGIMRMSASTKACLMRKRGAKLKHLSVRGRTLGPRKDPPLYESLAQLVQQIRPETTNQRTWQIRVAAAFPGKAATMTTLRGAVRTGVRDATRAWLKALTHKRGR